MTLLEFCNAVSETGRDWYTDCHGQLRAVPDYLCPIMAVYKHQTGDINNASVFGQEVFDHFRLGDLHNEIIRAADAGRGHDSAIRNRLLQACGLAEEGDQDDQR